MTGFGRGQKEGHGLVVLCEIRTVNYRGFDLKLRLPRELGQFEPQLQKLLRDAFARGHIDVTITLEQTATSSRQVVFDTDLARELLRLIKDFATKQKNLDANVHVSDLLQIKELFHIKEHVLSGEKAFPLVKAAMTEAIGEAMRARAQEGQMLHAVLKKHIAACQHMMKAIRKLTEDTPQKHLALLKHRLNDILSSHAFDAVRLMQEAAILADKSDVTEEIARLTAHFQHFDALCQSETTQGRKLDFLCQEMFREANTIGSKSTDTVFTHQVVELKAEVERLREQVQNIE